MKALCPYLSILLVALAAAVPADTIVLKNGKRVEGVVRDDGGDRILVKTERMDQWIAREQIAQIVSKSPADYFLQLGRQKMQLKNLEQAREAFAQALQADPSCEEARQQLDAIQAITRQQALTVEKARREASIQQLVAEAQRLLDRALDEEGLEVLRLTIEKDPRNVEALTLAAQTSLKTWTRFKTPEALLEKYLRQLEAVSPQSPVLAQVKQARDRFREKQQLNAAQDRQRLYDAIMKAHSLELYDYRLLNQIDRLLEMNPNESMKQRVALVQQAAQKAGVGRVAMSVSSVEKVQTER